MSKIVDLTDKKQLSNASQYAVISCVLDTISEAYFNGFREGYDKGYDDGLEEGFKSFEGHYRYSRED